MKPISPNTLKTHLEETEKAFIKKFNYKLQKTPEIIKYPRKTLRKRTAAPLRIAQQVKRRV